MISVELKVNGVMVGHIYGRNVQQVGADEYLYKYEYYEPEKHATKRGKVVHKKSDGIRELIRIILEDLER